jgi:uncharacterized protein with PIN domain
MKFLIDQDVYAITIRALKDDGHDVIPCSELGLSQAADETLLSKAKEMSRILVTRDRDYGTLVFAKQIRSDLPAHSSVYARRGSFRVDSGVKYLFRRRTLACFRGR